MLSVIQILRNLQVEKNNRQIKPLLSKEEEVLIILANLLRGTHNLKRLIKIDKKLKKIDKTIKKINKNLYKFQLRYNKFLKLANGERKKVFKKRERLNLLQIKSNHLKNKALILHRPTNNKKVLIL